MSAPRPPQKALPRWIHSGAGCPGGLRNTCTPQIGRNPGGGAAAPAAQAPSRRRRRLSTPAGGATPQQGRPTPRGRRRRRHRAPTADCANTQVMTTPHQSGVVCVSRVRTAWLCCPCAIVSSCRKLPTASSPLPSPAFPGTPPPQREAMLTSGVPQALGDELMPDASRLGEEITRAWAFHEMCATHADAMLDFCDDPSRACASHGWFCVVAGGRS